MDEKMKRCLIILSVVGILGLAIWGAWVLVKNYHDNRYKKLKEFDGLIVKASADAVKEFAEKKGDEASEDTDQVTEIAKVLPTIEIIEDDVKNAKKAVAKCVKEMEDKKKILEANEGRAKEEAVKNVSTEINSKSKVLAKKITVKTIQKSIAGVCAKAAKFATDDEIKKFFENGLSDEETAKAEICKHAKNAALDKAEELLKMPEYTINRKKVKAEAREALINSKATIKRDVVYAAIMKVAGVTK